MPSKYMSSCYKISLPSYYKWSYCGNDIKKTSNIINELIFKTKRKADTESYILTAAIKTIV